MHPSRTMPKKFIDVVLPANHEPAKVMKPSEKSFYPPTFSITSQRPPILGWCAPLFAMRCDHLDAIAVGQITIQAVTVVGFVADQSCGEGVEEACPRIPSTS